MFELGDRVSWQNTSDTRLAGTVVDINGTVGVRRDHDNELIYLDPKLLTSNK